MSRRLATPPRRLEDIEADLAPLLAERSRIRDEESAAEAKALLGRCFKYRNCYSLPQEIGDYWWLYLKVTHIKEFSSVAFQFQIDKYGKVEIDPARQFFKPSDGYIEIGKREFDREWRKTQARLMRMKP